VPTTFIRVRDKATGHEYDIPAGTFDEDLHAKVNAPKAYPDLSGTTARPRPIKFRTTKAGQPATTPKES